MKAIILAAGRGSRMGELTEERPKCMVELKGKPLLDWQVRALQSAGVTEISVVCGYRKEMVMHTALLKKFENTRWQHTNMVCSLMEAATWLRAEPCIVSYSDIFYDAQAVTSLINCDADIAITYDVNFLALWQARNENPLEDLETFKTDQHHRLLAIGEKPKTLEEIEGQYMGLLRFTPGGWAMIEKMLGEFSGTQVDRMDMTTLLRSSLERRISIRALAFQGMWGEVDTDSDLALYEAKLSELRC